jgi:hypothetical protein
MTQNQNILQTTESLKPINISKTNITSLQYSLAQAQNPLGQFVSQNIIFGGIR